MSITRKAAVWTIASLSAVAIFGAVNTAHAIELNLANPNPATSLSGETDQMFVDLVKKKTNGAVNITAHFGGALGYKGRDQYTAAEDGAIAFASTPFDKIVGLAPIYALQSLPFLTPTVNETKTMFDVAKPYYEKAFNGANQTLLYGAPWTPQGIWARKPIRSIADLKGLKMRTYDVTGLKTFIAAGAAPVQLSWTDVVPGLSTNTIEAVLTSDESGVNGKFWEYGVKYFNFLGYSMGISAVTMNQDRYKSLSADQQKAIRDAAVESEIWAWDKAKTRVASNKAIMLKNKAEYITDVPAEVIDHLKKAGAPLLKEWKAKMGPEADRILASFKKKMGTM
jgi:TRAP-type C4-dicarboxylate transport system substrate-binding protein